MHLRNYTCAWKQDTITIINLSYTIRDQTHARFESLHYNKNINGGSSNTIEREPGTTLPSKKVTSPAVTSCQGPRSSLLLAEPKAQMSHSAPAMQQAGRQAGKTAGLEAIDTVRWGCRTSFEEFHFSPAQLFRICTMSGRIYPNSRLMLQLSHVETANRHVEYVLQLEFTASHVAPKALRPWEQSLVASLSRSDPLYLMGRKEITPSISHQRPWGWRSDWPITPHHEPRQRT